MDKAQSVHSTSDNGKGLHMNLTPRFSPVIQWGHIIQAISLTISMIVAVWIVSARQTTIEMDVEYAKESIREIKQDRAAMLQALNNLATSVSKIEGKLDPAKP